MVVLSECIPDVKAGEKQIAAVHNTMRDGGNIFECPKPEWRIVQLKERHVRGGRRKPRYRSGDGMVSDCTI